MGGSVGNADPNHHSVITKKIFDYPYIVDTELYLLPSPRRLSSPGRCL